MAAEIFQVEVQNAMENSGCWDLVLSKPYDSSVLIVNQAPFPQSDSNAPEIETTSPKDKEVKELSNEEDLSQLFTSVDNDWVDEEECHEDEVQMFNQRASPYNLRNSRRAFHNFHSA